MTISRTLPRFIQTGKQVSSGVYEMQSNVTGSKTLVDSATKSHNGDPEGISFEVLAIYNDQLSASLQPVYAVMECTYSLVGSVHRLTRQATLLSSDSDNDIDFNAGDDVIRFIGVSSHKQFNQAYDRQNDVRILQEPDTIILSSGDNPVVDSSSTALIKCIDSHKVTPVSDNSVLKVVCAVHGYVRRDGTSGASNAGYTRGGYVTSTGTDGYSGVQKTVGYTTGLADTDWREYWQSHHAFTLTQSHRNNDSPSVWEIQNYFACTGGGRLITCSNVTIDYREILRV